MATADDTSVLIIGATGYSGVYVAAAFAEAGYRVAALQRPGGRRVPDQYKAVPGDLADPPSLLAAAIRCQPPSSSQPGPCAITSASG